VVTQTDLLLADGRTLHAYDAVADGTQGQLAVFWHHGTPNVGAPPEPLLPAAASSGIRWVSYDRPGYGGSTPHPGRDLASAAAGAAELRAAVTGRAALEEYLASAGYDPELFTPADHAALAGEWSWLLTMVAQAMEGGLGGMVDDDLACVAPWGFDPAQVRPPVLFVHGGQDRMVPSSHGQWLARRTPSAELWLRPDDGHVSVLSAGGAALDWLSQHAPKNDRRKGGR
jgi:pimeloyl-ACP methyl ester carboxylesterase